MDAGGLATAGRVRRVGGDDSGDMLDDLTDRLSSSVDKARHLGHEDPSLCHRVGQLREMSRWVLLPT
jgi:hypothetical protein